MDRTTRITIVWDTTDPNNHGWYVQCLDAEGCVITDSVKVTFPIDVKGYDRVNDLAEALAGEFPGTNIDCKGNAGR